MAATPDLKSFEKLRPLGALEQFSSARHHLGFYYNVGVTASYACSTEKSMPLKEIVFEALAAVIENHPVLSAIPVEEGSPNPYFVRLPTINLEEAVTFIKRKEPDISRVTDTELDHILEYQHNTPFCSPLPFWRLVVITDTNTEPENKFTACFIFHHSLGDGTSGLVFHKDFHTALQNSPVLVTSRKSVLPPNKNLLPNLELLHPLPIPASQSKHTPINLWSGEKVTMPTSSHFKSLYFSESLTRRFVQACKQEKTTVTATIPVIIATVLMKLIPLEFEELECTLPVSLRRWMPHPVTNNSFGVWIDAFSQYYRREKTTTFSWDEARRSRETINEYLESGGDSINVAKFRHIKDMKQFFLSRVGMERGTSFDCSNLGGVGKDSGEGMWKMGRMVFSRSAFVSGSAIAVGVVSGGDGCLSLGFSWQESIATDTLMEKLIQGVYTEVENLVRAK